MLVTPYQVMPADGTPWNGQTQWAVEHIYNTKREADSAYKANEKEFSLVINLGDIIVFNVKGNNYQLKVIGFTKNGMARLRKIK